MEVGQGPNWSCSVREKEFKICIDNLLSSTACMGLVRKRLGSTNMSSEDFPALVITEYFTTHNQILQVALILGVLASHLI
jgi:hypothetical protein